MKDVAIVMSIINHHHGKKYERSEISTKFWTKKQIQKEVIHKRNTEIHTR